MVFCKKSVGFFFDLIKCIYNIHSIRIHVQTQNRKFCIYGYKCKKNPSSLTSNNSLIIKWGEGLLIFNLKPIQKKGYRHENKLHHFYMTKIMLRHVTTMNIKVQQATLSYSIGKDNYQCKRWVSTERPAVREKKSFTLETSFISIHYIISLTSSFVRWLT